jgi:hypothetical protein
MKKYFGLKYSLERHKNIFWSMTLTLDFSKISLEFSAHREKLRHVKSFEIHLTAQI